MLPWQRSAQGTSEIQHRSNSTTNTFYSAVQCSVPAFRLAKYTASSIELTRKIHITYILRNIGYHE